MGWPEAVLLSTILTMSAFLGFAVYRVVTGFLSYKWTRQLTPQQSKISVMAGLLVGAVAFVALMLRWYFINNTFKL